jgi:CubicO group peptidase (beta-lactamase class C family)
VVVTGKFPEEAVVDKQQPVSHFRQQQWLWRARVRLAVGLIPLVIVLLSGCSGTSATQAARQQTRAPLAGANEQAEQAELTPSSYSGHPAIAGEQDTQVATQVNALFTRLVAQRQFSGSVLIARGGQVLLERGYSMANWATRTPNAPQTRFYLGSVTKEFTAMAILLLQQRGKLRVQNSICVYVKHCPTPWRPVTLHNVLTHTSGIPELGTSQLSGASPAAWIASFDNAALAFAPGSEFAYCSVCYQILAYVVQVVSGQPYSQFVRDNIFQPLHMTETGFDSAFFYAQPADAHGYAAWQSEAGQLGWEMSPAWSFLCGSGLLYSTVDDLYRWDQALYTNALASQQTRDAAFTSYTRNSLFAGSTYGYGWFIAKSPVAGHRLIWHDGVIDGFRTYIGRYIDDNVTIIFLSNLATVDSPTLAHSVQQAVFGKA